MKHLKKILLSLVLVLLLLGGFYLWQKSSIDGALLFATKDTQQISQMLTRQQELLQKQLERIARMKVRPVSTVQGDAIMDGTMTAEDAKKQIGATEQLESVKDRAQPTAEDLINDCVAELYGYQADLMETLGAMKQEAVDSYLALPAEQQTEQRLQQIGFDGLLVCYDLEDESDAHVRTLLGRYRKKLERQKADVSVLDTLWTAYENKKATEKAYYMDRYLR